MKHTEFVKAVADASGKTQKEVSELFAVIEKEAKEALKATGSLDLLKLVSLKVKDVPARDHRNPKTGETVHKPAHQTVAAKPTANLKNL